MKPKKAAVRPTPCPAGAGSALDDLEARRAQHAALVAEGYGAGVFHKDNGAPPLEDLTAIGPVKAAAHVRVRETPASKGEWRTNDRLEYEARFYTDKKQRGPGTKMPPASLDDDETRFLPVHSEQYLYGMATGRDLAADRAESVKRPTLAKGRKAGSETNRAKAEPLRGQIRAIWQLLPEHLRNATQVHKRLRTDDTVRTVRRHLLAMGLRKL